MLYDSKWLRNPKTFLSSNWCRLHHAFQCNQIWLNKFELMVWIATVAYFAESNHQVTQALLLLALSESVSNIPLPSDGQYNLSLGRKMKAIELENIAGRAIFHYEQTPAARLGPRLGESGQETWNRRHREYRSETKQPNFSRTSLLDSGLVIAPEHLRTDVSLRKSMCQRQWDL
jgi:hypothetical protein